MIDVLSKYFSTFFKHTYFYKDDLYLKLQKVFDNEPQELLSKVDQNSFNFRLLDLLTTLLFPLKRKIQLLTNNHNGSNEWNIVFAHQKVALTNSEKLKLMAVDKNTAFLSSNDSVYQDTLIDISRFKPQKILIFQIFEQYYYLLIIRKMNSETNRVLTLIQIIIKEFHNRLNDYREKVILKSKVTSLKHDIYENQTALRQSERLLKKRAYEIHNLMEISNELYSILNLDQLINSALLTLVGQLSCQRTFALIYNQKEREYSHYYSKGFKSDILKNISMEVDHPIVKYFLKRPVPQLVQNMLKSSAMRKTARQIKNLDIEIIAPLMHHGSLRGFIGCGSKLNEGSFDDADIQIFSILVNIISISISNAQMYEDVKEMSFTDAMTGLNNYRYFENRLIEEINRSMRNKTVVSLLMLDIDDFKNYNDELGHQAGDEALRTVGWILKNTVRDGDIVSRYGGEEFAIIMPGLEKDLVEILAERIRSKIEEFPFYKQHVQPKGNLTISLGGSTFPNDASNFETLINKADQALYYSKKSGRNCFSNFNEEMAGV
ncbi:MAG TPA: sensor domain-containing diguanylate cyclase [Caldithrix sp.]|nr:sensor domain-containing diguanylate cyclase [Caldithrix sp.]